jgi:hypothetical protein
MQYRQTVTFRRLWAVTEYRGFPLLALTKSTTRRLAEATMQATKLILTTDEHGQIEKPPHLPPNARLEAIFLVLEQNRNEKRNRQPSPKIAGLGSINADIMAPAADSDHWDALK